MIGIVTGPSLTSSTCISAPNTPASTTGCLARAAALRTDVEQALMSAVPGLRASIQLLPTDVEAHFDDVKDPL